MSVQTEYEQGPHWPRIGAVIAVALLAGFLVWLLVIRDDDEAPDGAERAQAPVATSEAGLSKLAGEVGHPIYWAGPIEGSQLEVKSNRQGEIFLRYLTGDAEIGDSREDYLTVGTYPFPDAMGTLENLAQEEGAITNSTPDGGFILTNKDNPTSVYIAYPDDDLQIEVYDPDPVRAFELASSGEIVAIE